MKRAIMTITFSIIFFLLLIIIPNTVHAEEYFDSDNKYMELHTIDRWETQSYNQLKFTFKVDEGYRYRIAIKDYDTLKEPEVKIRYLKKVTPTNGVKYDTEFVTEIIKLTETDSYGNTYYDFTPDLDNVSLELYINFKDDIGENKDILYDKVHVYHDAIFPVPIVTDLKIETTPSTAKLTWSRTDEEDDEYKILKVKAKDVLTDGPNGYQYDKINWEEVGKTKDNTYTVENLEEDTKYAFKIVTCRKRNKTEYPSTEDFLVLATTKVSPIPKVENLRLVENTPTSLKIEWDPVWTSRESYHYYQIEYYDFKENEWVIDRPYYETTSYSISQIEGKKYKYRVCARIDSKNNASEKYFGDYSNEIEFVANSKTPKKVTGLQVYSQTESSITLKWDPMLYATCYEIDMFDEETSKWEVLENALKFPTRYQVDNLQKGKQYKFKVRGIRETILDGNLEGEYSDELTVTLNSDKEKECLHSKTTVHNAKNATCTEKGYTGDIYCKDCDTKLSDGTEIPATGHKGGKATCVEKAKCEVCGEYYGEVNPENHVGTEVQNKKDVTCTEAGNTGDTYCTGCKKELEKGTEIPATGHKGGTATFTKGAICEICGVEYTKKLEEEKHKYPSNITFQDNYLKAGKTITIRQNANGKSVSFISLLADIVKSAIENKFPEIKVTSKLTGNIGTGKVVKLSNGDNITVIYKGDVNGDGKVSIADAGMMVRSSFGKIKLTEAQQKAGDIGGKVGEVNSSDAGVVVRLLFGGKNAEKAYNKIAEYMPEDM